MFLVMIPDTKAREQTDEKKVNWDFAQNELYLKKGQIEKEQMEER